MRRQVDYFVNVDRKGLIYNRQENPTYQLVQ
jgi:hypothetical protein